MNRSARDEAPLSPIERSVVAALCRQSSRNYGPSRRNPCGNQPRERKMTHSMIAAIYARKSTEQTAVADEQKSVARQIDHSRAYASRKGWTVADEHVYVDDGISGAEFANRPGFMRLMSALKPRRAFQVLVMSEESRLGREAIETAYALRQLVTAGVRVFLRSHVERRLNDAEAAVVRRIFELCAAGTGYTRIAKLLNAERAPAPRPQQSRPAGWAPTTVNEILHRSLYRGEVTWNRTRKRNRWGQHNQTARPA